MTDTILTNAAIVLADEVVAGSVVLRGTEILEVQPGRSDAPGAIDLDGDYLIAGVVDVHTDNLERQVQPRLTARWPSRSAMLAHDAQCAAAGVTTVLDALCLGDLAMDRSRIRTFRDAVVDLDALADTGLLKSEHFLHLRCEMPVPEVMGLVDPVAENPRVKMISLMDHSPGVGQYANLDAFRATRRKEGKDEAFIERRIRELTAQRERWRAPNRRALLDRVARLDVALASHDDRTEEEIEENFRDGIRISEFPVTLLAARAAHAHGMQVVAGGPNVVRGGSHSGNVDALDLLRGGALDAFASDYVPASLVEAAFICVGSAGISLPAAIAMVSEHPARIARLADRGRIAAGLRADLVRVRVHESLPVVRQVWRAGERVALMRPDARVALYYTPAADDPLWQRAADWLGRDAAGDEPRPQPDLPDIAAITADPGLYGFHATLKPPMRLRPGVAWDCLLRAVEDVAAGVAAFDLPRLAVTDLHGFLALRETAPSTELQALADACVAGPDALREPPDEAELARRRRHGLPAAQDAMLRRWGYPYVFATFFFHMTLTRRLTQAEHLVYRPAAEDFFAAALAQPRRVVDIAVFVQPAPGGNFSLAERIPLRG